MINVYENYRDSEGYSINNRTILLLKDSDVADDGSIDTYTAGPGVVAEVSGRIFIVDEWLIDQLDKVQFKDGALSVKEGMKLEPPVKSDKQLQIEAMERQLAALKAEPDEPADTEEQTDPQLVE